MSDMTNRPSATLSQIAEPDGPLSEAWLAAAGFKWHQMVRQPKKHWVLWLGCAMPQRNWSATSDIGIEVAECRDGDWFCWLRSDTGGRYGRFLHVRYVRTPRDLFDLISAITGITFNPLDCFYGTFLSPDKADQARRDQERLDQRFLREGHRWSDIDIERDDTRGRALPEHYRAAEEARHAKR